MTVTNFYADTETASECDLKKCGTAVYAAHPSTRIQLFSYSIGESDKVVLWSKEEGEPMPKDLKEGLDDPNVIFTFHNAYFDRSVIRADLKIDMPIKRYRCSMAQALSHSLPGSLDKLGDVLGVREDAKKAKDGKYLVQLFCKPRKQKDGTLKWATYKTHPVEWARYKEYCKQDTLAMKAIIKRMPAINYPRSPELEYWFMDQFINDYGMMVDLDLARAAMASVATEQTILAAKTKKMTKGEVESATQRDALLQHMLREFDIEIPNMQKGTLERLLDDPDTPEALRDLIDVRLSASTSSTAKYKKLLEATNADGRLRGTMQYCGASRTGRSGGKIYNPLNLPKPTIKHEDIILGIEALKTGAAEQIGFDIMPLSSSAIRYAIIAPPGKKFIVADLKGIEARCTPYVAEEDWKVQFFRDVDAEIIKYDNYVAAYAKAFNVPPETVTKEQRQIGKILELALGFGGSAGSMVSFCNMYHIDIADMAAKIRMSVPADVLDEAASFYDWMDGQDIKDAKQIAVRINKTKGLYNDDTGWEKSYEPRRTYGLAKEVFVALDSAKRLWRQSHSATVQCWQDADDAMRNAINTPNTKFWFGLCYMIRKGKWVMGVLPSGRSICYPGAQLAKGGGFTFMGIHQTNKQWCEIRTYGSKIFQNMVQALARDFLKYGQRIAWKKGYRAVLEIYDELLCEVPDTDAFTVDGLVECMATNPPWAPDLPLGADGFEDYRYHKSLD